MKPCGFRPPNLAARVFDLNGMGIPGTRHEYRRRGQELVYRLQLSPSAASRVYNCELHVQPGYEYPQMIVVGPDLRALAGDRMLPHTYPYRGKGVRLCLWKPKLKEWHWSMKLSDTYIPWTLRWLWYFEDWLHSETK